MSFRLNSPSFDDGARLPVQFTCEGEDISPALGWDGAPTATQGYALLCDDPDAPGGTWHHWALYDIATKTGGLNQAVPARPEIDGGRQAVNDFGQVGYRGPCPPRGHGTHHYRFRLLALDIAKLPLGADPTCAQVEAAAQSHVLGEARLVATYSR
ncbi:MAG: YbhB/YbcL family Raf kinase inhibitor-like protein [Planctomycetota bacterium]|jgi:Raf kinase inhibitor-like YbhB/YbcL family protein